MFSLTATKSSGPLASEGDPSSAPATPGGEKSARRPWGVVVKLAPITAVLPYPLLGSISQALSLMPTAGVEIGAYVEASLRTSSGDWHADLTAQVEGTRPPDQLAMPPMQL